MRTALQILQVGLSNRRVPQFLPVYSAWHVRLCVSCCCRSAASIKPVQYPSAGPSSAPPVVCHVRNCPKRVVAASCITVDVLFFRDVVNCVYRDLRGASSIDRAAPSALIV